MAAGSESQVIAAEIERVEPKVPTLFDRDDTFYAQLEKVPCEIVSSRAMRVPLEIYPGGKTRHTSLDGYDLGRGDMPTYQYGNLSPVTIEHALEWTTARKQGTDSSKKSVINAFRRDIASAMKEWRRNVDSLCVTSGNAVLATVGAITTSGGIDTYTLGFTGTTRLDGFGARLLRFDMDIALYNSTLTAYRTPAVTPPTTMSALESTIQYYSAQADQIQVPSFTGASVGDLVVASGLVPQTPPQSIFGVPYHDSNSTTGTWLTFNRATTPAVIASGVNANGGTLALTYPRLAMNLIMDRVGINTSQKLTAWMHMAQKQAYEELGFQISIINKEAKEQGLDLYFNDNMQMAGAPVKISASWDKTRIDFIDLENWGRAEYMSPQWYKDENGLKFFVGRGGTGGVATSNMAYLMTSFNIWMRNPAMAAYIYGLLVPAGYY
jgi:hypothetical protein